MEEFQFHAPGTLDEALKLRSEYNGDAMLLSGGTALAILLKQSLVQPEHIISLHKVPGLTGIKHEDGMLRVGAFTTQREMEQSPLVREHTPLLANTYSRVATVRIRNVATVGGGIAQADPAMDPPASLLILGASAKLNSTRGERIVPLNEIYADYYETTIEPDEILTELQVPVQPKGEWLYTKYLPRTEDDYATVSVSALGRVENGKIAEVRVGLGAVASTALRAKDLEESLKGASVSKDAIREAAQGIAGIVDPTDDVRGSADYKRDMAVVFTRRALEKVLGA
ncbi:MAG: xanthine dehydrogenase family protein subunit M [Dehalococcoidia bacterium]